MVQLTLDTGALVPALALALVLAEPRSLALVNNGL